MDLSELPQRPFRRHPWEVARARFFCDAMAAAGLLTRPVRVLDVGAGDAYFAQALKKRLPAGSQVTCVDPKYSDADLAGSPDIVLRREPPTGERFDLLLLLDVLEHVEDDRGLLVEVVRESLAPSGHALLSVPAWPVLFAGHDRRLGHFRRYTPATCRAIIAAAGLRVVRSGGLFHSLLLPRMLSKAADLLVGQKHLNGSASSATSWRAGGLVTSAVNAVLAVDSRASHVLAERGIAVPGLSWWALCRAR